MDLDLLTFSQEKGFTLDLLFDQFDLGALHVSGNNDTRVK